MPTQGGRPSRGGEVGAISDVARERVKHVCTYVLYVFNKMEREGEGEREREKERGRGRGSWSWRECYGDNSSVPFILPQNTGGGGGGRGNEEAGGGSKVGEEGGGGEGSGGREKEEVWSSSQDSMSGWCSDELDMEQLQALKRCSTDDDKISEWWEGGVRVCVHGNIVLGGITYTVLGGPTLCWGGGITHTT